MRRCALPPFLFLLLVGACFEKNILYAQTQSGSGGCPSSSKVSDDESVDEVGPKVVVDELTFDGPIHLTYSDLEPAIERLNQIGRSPNSDWLDEFLETSIRSAWQDRGYFKVLVDGRAEPRGGDAAHQHFSVTLHVDEGLQYRLGSLLFRAVAADTPKNSQNVQDFGPTDSGDKPTLRKRREKDDPEPYQLPVFPVEELRSLIPLQEGDLVSAEKIRQGLDGMRKLYGAHGYIDFTPTPETEVDEERQIISIRFVLDEQPQYRIGKIELVGLSSNAENALIWKVKPGDVFNYDLFKLFFVDNQAVLPEGSSESNSELRRNVRDGVVDIKMKFRRCPSQ
jgi:outer membrane protein assembly factor BamA